MFQPETTRPERPPHPRAAEMARMLAAIAGRSGRCTRDQILDEGFLPAEIDRHLDTARALAGRMLKAGPVYACRRLKGLQQRHIEAKLAEDR